MPNGRGRPLPPPLTLAQPPVAALAPRCAQRSAGSGGPLRHGRLCRRPGCPVPAESAPRLRLGGLRAGRGPSRPERGEAEGLAECEGLPHRTSGTGHQAAADASSAPDRAPTRSPGMLRALDPRRGLLAGSRQATSLGGAAGRANRPGRARVPGRQRARWPCRGRIPAP